MWIVDGKVMERELSLCGKGSPMAEEQLRQMGYKNPEEVFLASVSCRKLSCLPWKKVQIVNYIEKGTSKFRPSGKVYRMILLYSQTISFAFLPESFDQPFIYEDALKPADSSGFRASLQSILFTLGYGNFRQFLLMGNRQLILLLVEIKCIRIILSAGSFNSV